MFINVPRCLFVKFFESTLANVELFPHLCTCDLSLPVDYVPLDDIDRELYRLNKHIVQFQQIVVNLLSQETLVNIISKTIKCLESVITSFFLFNKIPHRVI